MKHNTKELKAKKIQDQNEMVRCDKCNQKVRYFRTNTCYCGARLCHICWSQHFHNDDER